MSDTPYPDLEAQVQMPQPQEQSQPAYPIVSPVRQLGVSQNMTGVPISIVPQQPVPNVTSTTNDAVQTNYITAVPVTKVDNGKYKIGRYGERQLYDRDYSLPIEIRCLIVIVFFAIMIIFVIVIIANAGKM
ncbi:hypothetical protein Ddc_11496 [Ditylenchus destructor]|nr:hypothetical protein Ddc_11496 [Ditylenchus destructor]